MTEATRARRRPKAALDSRIAASGLAACAALGMVVGMALGRPPEVAEAGSPPVEAAPTRSVTPPRPEIVIIQRRYVPADGTSGGGSTTYTTTSTGGGSSASAPEPAPAPAPPPTTSGGS